MALMRGVGGAVVAAALLLACVTRPVLEPGHCRRVDEVSGLDAELMALREVDRDRAELGLPAISWETRVFVTGADAHCAGDRALMDEPLVRETELEPLPVWMRAWRWFVRLVAF